MTEDGDLAQGTRNAIKVGICLLLVGQVLVNAYLYYVHGRLASTRTDPRVGALLIPGFIYLMATEVPEVLKKSAGSGVKPFIWLIGGWRSCSGNSLPVWATGL
jgi:hypothetical protein